MNISQDTKLDFDDVLIRPKRSTIESRKDVQLERTFKFKWCPITLTCVPVIASNMDTTGTKSMVESLKKHNMMTALHKHYKLSELTDIANNHAKVGWPLFVTIGLNENDFFRYQSLVGLVGFDVPICIDVANGYIEKFEELVNKTRTLYPNTLIMAGNVVTAEMTEQLILNGADIVKIGIGPGSVCTTRLTTGVGYPQFSAISECKDAAHGLGGLICSDGGCKNPGDVCKAFGAGADFVMLGGMFAGTDECSGEWIYSGCYRYSYCKHEGLRTGYPFSIEGAITGIGLNGEGVMNTLDPTKDGKIAEQGTKTSLKFYGMSSREAQDKYNGGQQSYRAAEGKSVTVPYKGPVDNVVREILGGLRSACAYVGAKRLKDFDKCCSFVRVNNTHNKIYE